MEYYGDERVIDLQDYYDNRIINKYKKIINLPHRYIVLMGGGGSGKSVFASQLVVIRTLESSEDMKTLVVRADNTETVHRPLKKSRRESRSWVLKTYSR
jgi:phage terminase large subunit